MSAFGVVTNHASSPRAQVTQHTAEDSVRRVVKALLAANDIKAPVLGAYLGIGKATIYKRLNGTLPFTVAEVAAVSEFFDVPVQVMFAGPGALMRAVPEAVAGGRAGAGEASYPSSGVSSRSGANAEVSGYSANPCLRELTSSHDSDTVVVSLAAHRGRRAGVAA